MGALEAAFGHFFFSDWTSILDHGFRLTFLFLCFGPSACSIIAMSSACGPHSSIHGSFLSECFVFPFRPVSRGLDLRFILCFRIAVTIILTPISRYIPPPIRLPFSLCSIMCPVWFVSSWTFVDFRLLPLPFLSLISFAFHSFCSVF